MLGCSREAGKNGVGREAIHLEFRRGDDCKEVFGVSSWEESELDESDSSLSLAILN